MPEYRRFVAYFYEYINGKKQKNAGFAKVELRNNMWRILFRLTAEIQPEPPIQVYGFVRENGWLLGLPFGMMRPGREIAEEWAYRAEHDFGTGKYRFENLAGIRIQSGDGRTFITVWDDEGMDPEKFVLEIPQGDAKQRGTNAEVNRADAERREINTAAGRVNTDHVDARAEFGDIAREETQIHIENVQVEQNVELNIGDVTIEQQTTESSMKAQNAEAVSENQITESSMEAQNAEAVSENQTTESSMEAQNAEAVSENQITESSMEAQNAEAVSEDQMTESSMEAQNVEAVSEDKTTDASMEAQNVEAMSEDQTTDASMEAQSTAALSGQQQTDKYNCVNDLLQKRQHFQPFSDNEITDCVQIMPCDIVRLQQDDWQVGRSSFLQHGYYQYRHLLMGRMPDGTYILGVPGIRSQQENYMAQMFGFDRFKMSKICDCGRAFGYWCRKLEQRKEQGR